MTDRAAFREALRRLLDRLDAIGETHGEIMDTMVRELLIGPIYNRFVLADGEPEMPDYYGLFTDEGNLAACHALDAFLADPAVRAFREASGSAEERLDAFQDATVLSGQGMTYDEYFGHLDAL